MSLLQPPPLVPAGSRQRVTPRWLYWALQLACLYLLACELAGVFDVLRHREELARMVPGGARLTMRPFVFGLLIAAGWWRWFRLEREGARTWALGAAAVLSVGVLVMWLNASVNDIHQPACVTYGYPLVVLVFFAYAVRGRERP